MANRNEKTENAEQNTELVKDDTVGLAQKEYGNQENNDANISADHTKQKKRPGRPRKNQLPQADVPTNTEVLEDANSPSENETEKKEFTAEKTEISFDEPLDSKALTDETITSEGTPIENNGTLPENNEQNEPENSENVAHDESIKNLLLGTAPDEDDAQGESEEIISEDKGDEDEMYPLPFDAPEASSKEEEKAEAEEEEEEKQLPPYDPNKPRRIDARFDLVELFIATLAVVMLISAFFFRHTVVDGISMESTLYNEEHLIISDLFYTPKRGDIIVFADYTTYIKKNLVKRVIAIEGDTVKITKSGEVYVNGKLLEEDYVYIDNPNYSYRTLEIKVPEGELFVMGDHRNESVDSRDPYVGTISVDAVLGRVLLRVYPLDKFGNPNKE